MRIRHAPSKPWTELGCPPEDLVKVVGTVVRGQGEGLTEWFRESPYATQVIEMLASRHRVGPFLCCCLKDTQAWEVLPEAARTRLLMSAEMQSAAADSCLQHLAELDDFFYALNLPFIVLKGPELAVRFGRGAASRGYRDIDILVREGDRSAVCRELEKSGYHRLSRHFLGAAASAHFNHAADYARDGRLLDLHWCISRLPGLRIANRELFMRAESLRLGGRTVSTLCPSDELLVLLLSSFADIQRGYLRLQPFVDIAAVSGLMSPQQWDLFFEARREDRSDRICRAVLELVVSLFSLQGRVGGLEPHLSDPVAPSKAIRVLLPSPGGRKAKRWAMKHLPVTNAGYFAWWAVSLPFRTAASHPFFRTRQSQAATDSTKRSISGRV
jgi:hypothetical protein